MLCRKVTLLYFETVHTEERLPRPDAPSIIPTPVPLGTDVRGGNLVVSDGLDCKEGQGPCGQYMPAAGHTLD